MKKLTLIEIILATLLIFCFFLPWFRVGPVELSAFQLPRQVESLVEFLIGVHNEMAKERLAYESSVTLLRLNASALMIYQAIAALLYLSPISSVITILRRGSGQPSRLSSIIAAAIPLTVFICFWGLNLAQPVLSLVGVGGQGYFILKMLLRVSRPNWQRR